MNKAKVEQPQKGIDGLRVSTGMLIAGAVVLFVFSGYMWNNFIRGSDKNIMWDSLSNALSTTGVEVVADDSDDLAVRRVTIKLDLKDDLSAEARSEFKDENTNSIIKTVSSTEKDYLFYEKNENKDQPRLREFEGTWVDISAEGQAESKSLADQLTNGSLILMANLSSGDRQALIRQMREDNTYTVLGTRGTVEVAGRTATVFKVKINSLGFNNALRKYFESIGLSQAATQIENTASGDLEPEVEIAIDTKKREVVATGFPALDATGAREYYNWGSVFEFEFPDESINAEELQNRIDSIYTPTTN
jgi:hypothetical protein